MEDATRHVASTDCIQIINLPETVSIKLNLLTDFTECPGQNHLQYIG